LTRRGGGDGDGAGETAADTAALVLAVVEEDPFPPPLAPVPTAVRLGLCVPLRRMIARCRGDSAKDWCEAGAAAAVEGEGEGAATVAATENDEAASAREERYASMIGATGGAHRASMARSRNGGGTTALGDCCAAVLPTLLVNSLAAVLRREEAAEPLVIRAVRDNEGCWGAVADGAVRVAAEGEGGEAETEGRNSSK